MINKKILGLIGLATKARKICYGADSVEEQIKKKKVYLVIIAKDSSERTKDKFKTICDECQIPMIIGENIETISKTIGKSNKAIVGIEEINLANEIQRINNGGELIG